MAKKWTAIEIVVRKWLKNRLQLKLLCFTKGLELGLAELHKIKKDKRFKKYLTKRFVDALRKKIRDDREKLQADYERYLELVNLPAEEGGDGENIFDAPAIAVVAEQSTAQELVKNVMDLINAITQTKAAQKELDEANKKIVEQ